MNNIVWASRKNKQIVNFEFPAPQLCNCILNGYVSFFYGCCCEMILYSLDWVSLLPIRWQQSNVLFCNEGQVATEK